MNYIKNEGESTWQFQTKPRWRYFYMDVQTGNILETDKNGKDEIYYLQSTLRAWYLDMREKTIGRLSKWEVHNLPEDEQGKKRKEG